MDHINEEELLAHLRESIKALAEQEGVELSEEQLDELAESALDEHVFELELEEHFAEVLGEEAYGQLDELSKKTLGSYVKKASFDAAAKYYHAGSHQRGSRDSSTSSDERADDLVKGGKALDKGGKRLVGIGRATKKLTKEEIDAEILAVLGEEEYGQLDELSKKTLGNYISAAAEDGRGHEFEAGHAAAENQHDAQDKSHAKARKRQRGIDRAIKKLTKEDFDEILAFAAEGKTVELGDAFASAMSARLAERLDTMRQDMAQKLFHDIEAGE